MPYEIHVRTESGKLYPLPAACDKDGKPMKMALAPACYFIEVEMAAQRADPAIPTNKLWTILDFHLLQTDGDCEVKLFTTEDGVVGALQLDADGGVDGAITSEGL